MEPTLRATIYTLQLRHTFRISRAASDTARNVYVALETQGIVGYGEAAPIARYGENAEETLRILRELPRHLLDDPFDLLTLRRKLNQLWGGRHAPARAALEMACYDWVGRRVGLPLYRLWGLNPEAVPQTSFTLGLDSLDVILAKLEEAGKFPILKVKLGGREDLRIVEEIRKRTDRPIRVDANEGWTRDEAAEKIRALAKLGVEFVEQPLPASDLEGTRWVRDRVDLPLFADESVHTARDIPTLVGAFDGINIKLMKCGGLWEAREMIAVARALGMKVMLGCMVESTLAIAAMAHFAPLVDYLDLDGNLLITNDPFSGLPLTEDGRPILPQTPGIGVQPRVELFPEITRGRDGLRAAS